MSGTWAWTMDREIYVPEVNYTIVPNGCTAVALRGYRYTSAVVTSSGQCIGWVVVVRDEE